MKKSIFALAMAAVLFTACQEKEVVATNNGDAISFNTVLNNATKANPATTANLTSFVVDAMKVTTDPDSTYFADVTFTKSESNFRSATSYYWPSDGGSLNFYAYAPAADAAQVVKTDTKTFVVTPDDDPADQVDFIYAAAFGKNKATCATGVALNFRHAESQVVVQVKNSSDALKFVVDGWKVANVNKKGTFTYAGSVTSTNNAATFAASTWSYPATPVIGSYSSTFAATAKNVAASTTTAEQIGESMILIPQSVSAAAKYDSDAYGAGITTGSYIAVKMKVLNSDDSLIFPDTDATAWAIWPVAVNWVPGYKYIYTVDLASGGYHEDNTGDEPDPDNPDDDDFDPVLDTPIFFTSVTVDVYKEGLALTLNAPVI